MQYLALIHDFPESGFGNTGATATGFIRIALVPEPATALLFAAALALALRAQRADISEIARKRGEL